MLYHTLCQVTTAYHQYLNLNMYTYLFPTTLKIQIFPLLQIPPFHDDDNDANVEDPYV